MSTESKRAYKQGYRNISHSGLGPVANNNVAFDRATTDESACIRCVDPKSFRLRITESSRMDRRDGWRSVDITLAELETRLLNHREIQRKKDGEAFVPGVIRGDRRKKTAVSELTALVLDLDKGEDLKEVNAAIRAKGLYAIVHTTFSHLSRETEITLDAYRKFVGNNEVTPEGLRRYLIEVLQYRPWVVEDVEVASDYRDTAQGAVCVARHAPLRKLRIVFPLLKPFSRRDIMASGCGQAEFERLWKAKYAKFADSLGVAWDQSCSDVSRCFFYPSCKPGVRPGARKIEGQLLDLDGIEVETPSDSASVGKFAATRREVHPNEFTFQGFNLKAWAAQHGLTFEIESAMRANQNGDDLFRCERDAGGVHIECPFEHEHTELGGTGTFVVNASDNEGRAGFGIHCCHKSCLTRHGNGTSVDRLLFIQQMLEDGWLTLKDLQNAEFGGGSISPRSNRQNQQGTARDDLRVVDKDGKGIDVGIFHASMIAKPGLFDFARLNQLCGTQIAPDVTDTQLAAFIENRRVTVAQLIECAVDQEDGAYAQKLTTLARKKVADQVLGRDADNELFAIARKFKTKQTTVNADFKRAEKQARSFDASSGLGILSSEETALIKPMRDYVKDFAIINTGGKAMVMALGQPDLSKAIMSANDFELLHRNEWIDVVEADGSASTVFPAKRFLAKPPKDAQVYHGGFVFKPEGTVAADEFNLYRGMRIEPDASGSCSMLRELIRDVWAQGDERIAKWVLEYLMHIVAYPGQKVGTSIAIRGGFGDGKSIVFAKLMGPILGDMLLRVTNHKMILGDFNESLIGKLLTVLEEAAFAGDKPAFDKMKELITGETVLINPKFKAPITVANFSRLIVISNHAHFLHIRPGDRRYTVLESSPIWIGTDKFDKLLGQWAKGGAQRFVYEALNHPFTQLEGAQRLVINTNLKTEVAVRQMAQSRSALEKCIVKLLLSGDLKSAKEHYYEGVDPGNASNIERWELDESLEVRSQALEKAVVSWLRDFDSSAVKHEATLHTIIDTLLKYVGETEARRPKGLKDASTGKRPQLPTLRYLPPRRQAIQHAWDNGLITDEEYAAAIPEPKKLDTIEGFADEDETEALPFPLANTG